MKRRTFLASILALGAPASPVSAIQFFMPKPKRLYGDGVHDDTEALQAFISGEEVIMPNGSLSIGGRDRLPFGTFAYLSRIAINGIEVMA